MTQQSIIKGLLEQLPITILHAMGIKIHTDMKPLFQFRDVYSHVNIFLIHNFGLKEVIQYKPQFLLKNTKVVAALFTKKPTIENCIDTIFNINQTNLFEILYKHKFHGIVIGTNHLSTYAKKYADFYVTANDMASYVKTVTYVNRANYTIVEFRELNKQNNNISKLFSEDKILMNTAKKTDDFIKLIYKQVTKGSINFILGIPNINNPAVNIPVSFALVK